MKTIKYMCIFALVVLSFSCSKNDDSSEEIDGDLETLIIGSWKITSKTLNGEAVVLNCANGLSSIWTFSDTEASYDVDSNDGNDCVTIPYSATYSIDGNSVIINDPFSDNGLIWTVLSINDTTFKTTYTSPDNDVSIRTYQKN
jgi:hypothetical protein